MAVNCPQWSDGTCTAGYYGGRPSKGTCEGICKLGANPKMTAVPANKESDGRAAWTALHLRAMRATTIDPTVETAWLASWLKGDVSCGACRGGGKAWVEANPPDLSSPAAYFAWTVKFHNAISATLSGKPQWTVEQATLFWSNFMPLDPAALNPALAKPTPPRPEGPERLKWSLAASKDEADNASIEGNYRRYVLDADGKPYWLMDQPARFKADSKTVAADTLEAKFLLAAAAFFAAKANE